MSPEDERSPWLGGPGARWAQVLLLVLHAALVVALVICAWSFWRLLPRVDLEVWQTALFFAGILVSLVVFGRRTVRIAADLVRARREPPPRNGGEA